MSAPARGTQPGARHPHHRDPASASSAGAASLSQPAYPQPQHGGQQQQPTAAAAAAPAAPRETREQKTARFFETVHLASAARKDVQPTPRKPPPPPPVVSLSRLLEGLKAPPPPADGLADVEDECWGPFLASAERLVAQGSWADIISLTGQKGFYPPLSVVHSLLLEVDKPSSVEKASETVRRVHVHALALSRLGRPTDALAALKRLDAYRAYDFSAAHFHAETQEARAENVLPARSIVPFSLVLLRASLEEGTAPLYTLLVRVENTVRLIERKGERVPGERQLYRQRRRATIAKLAAKHRGLGEASPVLKLLTDACTGEYEGDAELNRRRVAALMNAGLIAEAAAVVAEMAAASSSGAEGAADEASVASLQGLVAVCHGKIEKADCAFSAHSAPTDISASNNKAVCAVYSERLPEAIRILERAIASNPSGLTEPAAQNLCNLYDMESEAPADKKALLYAVAETYKGRDFAASLQATSKPA
eukprot:Rhum_TRINITY_DN14594_c8_g1::Rhum_TRINITY_DN14594_c8_g1_i1::g.101470::m.101470/K20309/TRAPPC12; trafficking protein particle complex subunit 12